jgi:hypothetical protein
MSSSDLAISIGGNSLPAIKMDHRQQSVHERPIGHFQEG